jgi:hypothetical protein
MTKTEETINQDYKDGWRYIVWVGGNDDYYKNYKDAKRDADEWKAKGYDDDVIIEEIVKKPSGCFVHKKVEEIKNDTSN